MTTPPDTVAASPVTYRARRILPLDGPPLDDGHLVVVNGRITAVGSQHVAEGRVIDLGYALVPRGTG